MNRQQKEQIITSLQQDLQSSNASFVVGYRGLTVAELLNLRRQLDKAKGKLQVAKITLIKRALADQGSACDLDSYLSDQIALVFAEGESPAVAKILCEFAKSHNKLKVIAGCYEDAVLTGQDVQAFASLPPREVLLAQLCGTLQAPITRLAGLLNNVVASLPRAVQEIQKKKSSE